DAFRDWVSADGSTPFPAASGRYHLYISLACPWASRSLIVRNLSGLQEAIGVTVVDPIRDERGWAFRDGPGYSRDPVNNFSFLSEAYRASSSKFDGRVTVPVLWDKQTRRIVDYPNLQGYLLDLYQQPGIAATVNFDHIKRHYYITHDDINPTRIVPIGPEMDLTWPHGRERLGP